MGNVLGWSHKTLDERVWDAARAGDVAILTALAPTRSNIEFRDLRAGRTPFTIACAHGHVATAQWLRAAGADEYTRDYEGNTPLHHACQSGQARIVQYLLSLPEFSPYVLNAKGDTPLEVARRTFQEHEGDNDDLRLVALARCIELLEQRCSVYSGWMFQRVETLLSQLTGITALQAWTRRYCIVLRTSSSMFLEVALFAVPDASRRPPVPSASLLVHVTADEPCIRPTNPSFWSDLNPKPFGFELRGAQKVGSSRTQALRHFSFAALSEDGAAKWLRFFAHDARDCLQDALVSPTRQFNSHELGRAKVYPEPSAPLLPTAEVAQPVVFTKATLRPRALECVVCFDGPQAAVCVPCGHNVLCMKCAMSLLETTHVCPVCRLEIREVVKVYRN